MIPEGAGRSPTRRARAKPLRRTKTAGGGVRASALSLSENRVIIPPPGAGEGRGKHALKKARDLFHAGGGDDVMTEEEVVKERKPGGN